MKILLDMNLSPEWVSVLSSNGHTAIHWNTIGKRNAPDSEILLWARENGYAVFTHDLDFCAILAATGADSPSVIQMRVQDINPNHTKDVLLSVLSRFEEQLEAGVLLSVDLEKSRARLLPLK